MRRVTISGACVLVIWMIALMSTDVSADQPQATCDVAGSSLAAPHRSLAPGP